jgi:thiamine-phosphate pyrophosphorylase
VKKYCITDSAEVAARAAASGAAMIQVRAKNLPARELAVLVKRVVAQARGVPVLVNTRTDIALACGAQGVHLPSDSPSPERIRAIVPAGFLIGVSCHNVDELQRVAREGADFAVYGPIFPTRSHPDAQPIGLDALAAATRAVRLPIYALGGVTEKNAPMCIVAGAAGVAGISMFG